MNSEGLTPNEAAIELGYSGESVRRWCESGYIVATRRPGPRGDWQIPRSEIDRLIANAAGGEVS